MMSMASLLPRRGVSPSASRRSSKKPALVVLMATATRAAGRAPVADDVDVGGTDVEVGDVDVDTSGVDVGGVEVDTTSGVDVGGIDGNAGSAA